MSHLVLISQTNQNREYTVKVSYIEIYKEELRDLLDLDTSSKDLHIREDDQGNTCKCPIPK
jgi:kinesin family protein 4/21/27